MAGNQIVCRPSEKVKNALMEAKDAVVAGVGTNWAHKEMQNKKVAPSEGTTNCLIYVFLVGPVGFEPTTKGL